MDHEVSEYEPITRSPATFAATLVVTAAGVAGTMAISSALVVVGMADRLLGSLGVKRS